MNITVESIIEGLKKIEHAGSCDGGRCTTKKGEAKYEDWKYNKPGVAVTRFVYEYRYRDGTLFTDTNKTLDDARKSVAEQVFKSKVNQIEQTVIGNAIKSGYK